MLVIKELNITKTSKFIFDNMLNVKKLSRLRANISFS